MSSTRWSWHCAALPFVTGQRVLDVTVLLALDSIRPSLVEYPDERSPAFTMTLREATFTTIVVA
ncbi:MAG: hypothetical protein H0U37_08695 [Chloroflexi bacterium]|nr:hypothetical protein [Chloroflexota bacterium]